MKKGVAQGRDKRFEQFKKCFTMHQNKFGLNGYKVYFKYEPIADAFAQIQVNQEEMVTTVFYNSDLPDKEKPFRDPEANAKHEALHLLIARISDLGRRRYVSSDEISEAQEELIRRLEKLIGD